MMLIGGSFRVTLVVDWWFLPKIFGPWWGPTKVIYRSVNTDRVIILFAGGGDTWTQFSVIEVVWTFCTERRWGAKTKFSGRANQSCRLTCMVNSLSACGNTGNEYGVVILFGGGGDTWTQFSVIELVWTFCTERRWGAKVILHFLFFGMGPSQNI